MSAFTEGYASTTQMETRSSEGLSRKAGGMINRRRCRQTQFSCLWTRNMTEWDTSVWGDWARERGHVAERAQHARRSPGEHWAPARPPGPRPQGASLPQQGASKQPPETQKHPGPHQSQHTHCFTQRCALRRDPAGGLFYQLPTQDWTCRSSPAWL